MIAKCSPISHGATAMSYNNRKEMSELIAFHGLPKDSNKDNFWSRMMDFQVMKRMEVMAWKPLKNTALRFELSPENKYTEDWTLEDWHRLALDFLKVLDSIDRRPEKKGKRQCSLKPTNLLNTQYVVTLHHDSKSGIRHLHILANRVDLDGHTNDAHYIGERAVEAANRISMRRGWDLAADRRQSNIEELHTTATEVLRDMPGFSWALFTAGMHSHGYSVELKEDSKGTVRGMSFRKGNSVFKSSELGHGRDLVPSRIEDTWRKLRMEGKKRAAAATPEVTGPKPAMPVAGIAAQQPKVADAPKPVSGKVWYHTEFGGKTYATEIDRSALGQLDTIIEEEMAGRNAGTGMEVQNVAKAAMLIFGGYLDAATSMSESVGGGGGPGGGWGRRDDEDDLDRLRRCVHRAVWMCKPMQRTIKR